MKHPFLLFTIFLLLILIAFLFWKKPFSEPMEQSAPPAQESVRTPPVDQSTSTELTPSSCEDSGGRWNECGSACRTQPGVPCIELCVPYCECQASNECPTGFSCTDFVQGIGICV
ncbi:hypothetical protein HYV70_00465 [Candidatus Uhrbacteria bacterium]|nr:hypothetical protein [Candidatus Uhrbacteria bacterium]